MPLKEVVDITVAGFGVPAGREPPGVARFDAAWEVQADRSKMHQALLNVLSNAYKYSPGGGAVELLPRHAVRAGRPCVGIAVRDQGIGMDQEQLSHMCERFYRADASGNIPGTGLGMAIVGDIVKLHGGSLEFASRPGEGTTVTLWLPQAEAEQPLPELAAAA
jgi:signal transduction histidine kinase